MVKYQVENYKDIIEEMKPLLEEHYKEIAMYQDHIDLNPNYYLYELMSATGQVHFFSARDDGKLIGYCVTFVHPNPHYKDHIYAVNDIVYVDPEYRHSLVAPTMLTNLEAIMKDAGVSVMSFHMKTYKPFESLMSGLGYDKAEILFMKYIKEE